MVGVIGASSPTSIAATSVITWILWSCKHQISNALTRIKNLLGWIHWGLVKFSPYPLHVMWCVSRAHCPTLHTWQVKYNTMSVSKAWSFWRKQLRELRAQRIVIFFRSLWKNFRNNPASTSGCKSHPSHQLCQRWKQEKTGHRLGICIHEGASLRTM